MNNSTMSKNTMIKLRFMLLAMATITLLVALLIMNNRRVVTHSDDLMVRPMEMVAVLPPPPPPKQITETTPDQALKLDLRHQGQGPSLTLSKTNIKIKKTQLNAPEIDNLSPDFEFNEAAFDLSSFALNELDQQPHLMTPLNIQFTARMQSSGVKKVEVKLHVVIDTNGKVHLKNIKKNPYPELNPAIKKLVSKARFSAPQRQGKNVQAEFIWPLVLKES